MVDDETFDRVPWEQLRAVVQATGQRAAVLFVADNEAMREPSPVRVVDLSTEGPSLQVRGNSAVVGRQRPEPREHGLGRVHDRCGRRGRVPRLRLDVDGPLAAERRSSDCVRTLVSALVQRVSSPLGLDSEQSPTIWVVNRQAVVAPA